jgi:flagellar capping protein FliD
MWEEIFNLALSNGIWSAMFLGLLIYQLKDSNKREKKYQETISKLNEHLGAVSEIKEEVKEIRQAVMGVKVKVKDE